MSESAMGESAANESSAGPVLFARYAYPPNHYGYCGPDDPAGFFRSGATGDERGLRDRAREFDGAWEFLQLIADARGASDPLAAGVVEAYWLGDDGLDSIPSGRLRPTVAAAFDGRCGPLFDDLPTALSAGALPHHSFLVLCVYPWVGMLGDPRRSPQALRVLDRCRIRSGRVRQVAADHAEVTSEPLIWTDGQLRFGEPATETVRTAIDGVALRAPLVVGDRVALHWDWVCDVITPGQEDALRRYTARHLALVNRLLPQRVRGLTGQRSVSGHG